MPRSRGYCWVKDRVAASNMAKNIRRAVRRGNCKRARQILNHSEYHWVQMCSSHQTQHRLNRLVERCRESGA